MNTKQDYERAAKIVQAHYRAVAGSAVDGMKDNLNLQIVAETTQEAFVAFFRGENSRFDATRFRAACKIEE